MILNKKVINYKILYLIILYNFDIKFDFIQDHVEKNINFFDVRPFVGAGHAIKFLGKGDPITRPWKWCHF